MKTIDVLITVVALIMLLLVGYDLGFADASERFVPVNPLLIWASLTQLVLIVIRLTLSVRRH